MLNASHNSQANTTSTTLTSLVDISIYLFIFKLNKSRAMSSKTYSKTNLKFISQGQMNN